MPTNADCQYGVDELVPPQWINADFCTKVLRHCERDDMIQVQEYKISPASQKGDHYASIMFRVAIQYVHKQQQQLKHVIVKTMPVAESPDPEVLGESFIFETESGMYTDILPRMQALLRGIGDDTELAPKMLYHSFSPTKVLVLEDLCPQGFSVIRRRDLTMDETKQALLHLAKFHAVGYKLNNENPLVLDKYRYSAFTMPQMIENDLFVGGFNKFVNLLQKTPALNRYKPYFEPLQKTLIAEVKAIVTEYRVKPQSDVYYVLNHGDFHERNMMFKYQRNGLVDDMKLFDYQFSFMGPITYDVFYSMFMIWSTEQRLHHRDELLYYYFRNFTATLEQLGYKGEMPQLREFRKQLVKHRYLEFFFATIFLPIIYGLRVGSFDVDTIVESDEYRMKFYAQEAYIHEMEQLLQMYLNWGYFEN